MLKVWTYQNRLQIEEQLLKIDFEKNTWILSDLRSKLEIQSRLFQKLGFTLDDYVMRASDLWRAMLRKSEPDFEVISHDYALLLVKHFLGQISSKDEAFRGLSEKVWLDQLSRWSLVVFTPELKSEVAQYLELHTEYKNSWGREFLLAGLLAQYFQSQKKLISKWIPGVLQSSLQNKEIWDRPLWVDLRGELSQSEAELFRTLSRTQEINILVPESDFEKDYFEIAKPYEYLISQAQTKQSLPPLAQSLVEGEKTVLRFSGALAEVKWAVAQVRSWLDSGTALSEIAIVAPDIETYWPCLESYLQVEGIPTQKPTISRLSSFPVVKHWLSVIRASLNPLDFFSHEKMHFGSEKPLATRYEEFRSFLFELYDPADLGRLQKVWELAQSQPKWPELVSRDEFLARCLLLWPLQQTDFNESLIMAVEKFLREAQAQTVVRPQDWLNFLESIFSKGEVSIQDKSENGLVVASLMSAWSHRLKKVLFLGMAEENLKSFSRFGLSPIDSVALSRDLGVVIESVEQNLHEYELQWWLKQSAAELFFLQPNTDWSGQLLNHSPLFLHFNAGWASELPSVQTRWDQIQLQGLEILLPHQQQVNRIYEDLGEKEADPVSLAPITKLSPSAVESYLKCQFIFLASRGFKLLDQADVDIDIDRQKNGQFHHALVDRLIKGSTQFEIAPQKIIEILEELREKYLYIRSDDSTWIPRRNKFVKWAQHFLANEKQWSLEHPQNKILATEVPWSAQVKDVEFRGQIDRIDGSPELKQWMVIDYKSSSAGMPAVKSWLEKGKLQLLFYLWAVEQATVPDVKGQALGAFFYNLKNLNRQKGLRLNIETPLLPPVKSKASAITEEKYQELLAGFQVVVDEVLAQLSEGHFKAKPMDETDCITCPWKKICRAPHLNQN